jgi:hypothetical protein
LAFAFARIRARLQPSRKRRNINAALAADLVGITEQVFFSKLFGR